jgi:hypothetical protein
MPILWDKVPGPTGWVKLVSDTHSLSESPAVEEVFRFVCVKSAPPGVPVALSCTLPPPVKLKPEMLVKAKGVRAPPEGAVNVSKTPLVVSSAMM